jgi:hypothetical protein
VAFSIQPQVDPWELEANDSMSDLQDIWPADSLVSLETEACLLHITCCSLSLGHHEQARWCV